MDGPVPHSSSTIITFLEYTSKATCMADRNGWTELCVHTYYDHPDCMTVEVAPRCLKVTLANQRALKCALEGLPWIAHLPFRSPLASCFLLFPTSRNMAQLLLDREREAPWVGESPRLNSACVLRRHLCGPDTAFRHSDVPMVCQSHATHEC